MSSVSFAYRLRIRNAANSADALTVTSVRGGTNPWLSSVPEGDGQEFDPLEGSSRAGAYTGRITDGITSGSSRIVTAQLEDADERQQLVDRRAFVEYSTDGGSGWSVLIAGYLTGLRLATDAEYEYTVSDASRAQREFTAFKPKADPTSVDGLEPFADFLDRWPNRGCIFGGPIRVSGVGSRFLRQEDRGGWEMSVDGQTASQALLTFIAGYTAPRFGRETNAENAMAAAKDKTDGMFTFAFAPVSATDSIVTFQDARYSSFPGIVVEVMEQDGDPVGFYQAYSGIGYFGISEFITDNGRFSSGFSSGGEKHLLKDIRHRGIYIGCKTSLAASGLPTAGTKVRVRAFTAEVSELSPIYWTGHPVEFLTKLWDEADIDYDATTVTSATNAIGAHRRMTIRATSTIPLGELVRQVCAAFGLGVRSGDDGELEPFKAWITDNPAPTDAITDADVVTGDNGGAGYAFEIDASTAVRKVVYEYQRLIYAQEQTDPLAVDGFVAQTVRIERTNADTGAIGNREVMFTAPFMVHTTDSDVSDTEAVRKYVDTVSKEIFDRYGRGVIGAEVHGLRGGSTDSMVLGDEIVNELSQLPNHNKRLGDDVSVAGRAMQIVRSTWTPQGPIFKVIDSGPNEQPYGTVPTHTIAASSALPRTVAEITITNAATLNADDASLTIQWAVTTGSAPSASDYTSVLAYAAGMIPTAAIRLPAVVAGRKVYARASATKVGERFSTWSTPVSVTLTSITAPSSVSVTPSGSDGSLATVTWTVGDSSCLVDVFLRLTADSAGADVLVVSLPRGSDRYVLEGLTPSAGYTVGVRHRDEQNDDVSSTATQTFTAGATTVTLSTPLNPQGFAGTRDATTGIPHRDSIYGIGVNAQELPGMLEVAVAIETAVGAGTYGSFVTSGTQVPSIPGNWSTWTDIAPNDGLRRQLKARHVRTGATSSSYASIVTVTPWTPLALPVFTDGLATESVPQGTVSIDANGNYGFTIDLPENAVSFRYTPNTAGYTADATVAAGGTIVSMAGLSTHTINSVGTLSFGQTIFITVIPFTGASATGTQLQALHIRGAYLTLTASKTVTYSPSDWQLVTATTASYWFGTGEVGPEFDAGTQEFALAAILPNSVTITAASVNIGWTGTASACDDSDFLLYRRTATTQAYTSIGSQVVAEGTQTTSTISSLSESTASRHYMAKIVLDNFHFTSASLADMALGGLAITYTMGDPLKTV